MKEYAKIVDYEDRLLKVSGFCFLILFYSYI